MSSGPSVPAPDAAPAPRGREAFAAEFVGTLLLVFAVSMAAVLHTGPGLGVTDYAVIGLVHVLVLVFLVHTLGRASGAHFNPAVTVTLAALRKIGPLDALTYVALQVAGALAGVLLVRVLLPDLGEAVGYGAPRISAERFLDGALAPAFLAELLGTFVLMWAIMGVAVDPQGARDWAGLVIGAALGVAVMVLAPLTGAGLNPARAYAPSLLGGGEPVLDFLVAYVLGPLVGALLAGTAYTALIMVPQGRGTGRAPRETFAGAGAGAAPAAVPRPVDRLD